MLKYGKSNTSCRSPSTERFLLGGMTFERGGVIQFDGGGTNIPIMGIIGLDYDPDLMNPGHALYKQSNRCVKHCLYRSGMQLKGIFFSG